MAVIRNLRDAELVIQRLSNRIEELERSMKSKTATPAAATEIRRIVERIVKDGDPITTTMEPVTLTPDGVYAIHQLAQLFQANIDVMMGGIGEKKGIQFITKDGSGNSLSFLLGSDLVNNIKLYYNALGDNFFELVYGPPNTLNFNFDLIPQADGTQSIGSASKVLAAIYTQAIEALETLELTNAADNGNPITLTTAAGQVITIHHQLSSNYITLRFTGNARQKSDTNWEQINSSYPSWQLAMSLVSDWGFSLSTAPSSAPNPINWTHKVRLKADGSILINETKVVGSQQSDPGAAPASPTVTTGSLGYTAGATYGANEQNMLNAVQGAVNSCLTNSGNLKTAVDGLRTGYANLRTALQAHGLIA